MLIESHYKVKNKNKIPKSDVGFYFWMTKKEKILIPPKSYASIGVYLFYVYFNNSVNNALRSVKYKKN